ncbi:amino acid adenylation domain-containing protein [Marinibacterium sp. SX1]|uniref:amino acid adenylation domain-containing protein n=1 Tax=Marinibacterium sp. SX1 TaxID=3388424 RepID=UPI003D16E170
MSVALIAPGAGLSWPGASRAGKGGDAGRAGSGNDADHVGKGGDALTGPVAGNGSGTVKGRDVGNDAAMAKGGALVGPDLIRRTAGLAGWIAGQVAPGDRVAICLPKGPSAVMIMLAAFAAGAVAVPLDPAAPPTRLRAMLDDLAPGLVFAAGPIAATLGDGPGTRIETAPDAPDTLPMAAPIALVAPADDQPAMILMTSGSTGRPKGVVLSHGNLATFIDWAVATFALTGADRFLSLAPMHFDLSVLDIHAALRLGARVHLLPDARAGFAQEVMGAIRDHRVSVLYTVPTQLRLLTGLRAFERARPEGLRWLLSAGEVLPAATLRQLVTALPDTRFANLYGPTETNVICCHVVEGIDPGWVDVPIGQPCAHAAITIRDTDGRPLPPGEEGEICVVGPSVMAGYWQRPELTQAARLDGAPDSYRTGDYGRIGPDGGVVFLGRRDAQVKVRGFRVETGEIEAAAQDIPGVALAVALPQVSRDGTTRIILAVLPAGVGAGSEADGAVPETDGVAPAKDGPAPATEVPAPPTDGAVPMTNGPAVDLTTAVTAALAERLPPQSRPAQVVPVDAMPRTSSGKIDRRALADQLFPPAALAGRS